MPKAPKTLTLGAKIDTLYLLRAMRIEHQRSVDEMKIKERVIRQEIMDALEAQDSVGSKGKVATASITVSIEPRPGNWKKTYAYIHKHKAYYLLHQRISSTAWRELYEAGKEVPGIEAVTVKDLSLAKAHKGYSHGKRTRNAGSSTQRNASSRPRGRAQGADSGAAKDAREDHDVL